ncbi:RICIN domain-containing protein [Kitasatospora sp. NPDC059577]|uniref:RICIN domain-containing protein n=1 Tax=Kitasatospora sp. NPDC059577 TaxID=3346873 RepID=UPI0036CB53D8
MTAVPDRTRLRTIAGALAAAGLALAPTAPAGADVTTPGSEDIPRAIVASDDVKKCLEVADWRTDDGAPVRLWSCTGGANQQWVRRSGSTYVNVHSGKCLEIPGSSTTWGTQADQWTCHGGPNQQWRMIILPQTAVFHLQNEASRLFLDVSGAGTADGTPVIQWQPTMGASNQYWRNDPSWRR